MHYNHDMNTYRKAKNILERQDNHTSSDLSFWQWLRQLLYMKMHVSLETVRGYLTGEGSLMLKHKIQEYVNIKLIRSEETVVLSK